MARKHRVAGKANKANSFHIAIGPRPVQIGATAPFPQECSKTMSRQLALSIAASVLAMTAMVLMDHAAMPGLGKSRAQALRISADREPMPLLRRLLPALQ